MKNKIQDFQEDTLMKLSHVSKYNEWIVSKFENYLKGNILELGAGTGNITCTIQAKGHTIIPTDIDRKFLTSLRKISNKAFYLDIQKINVNKQEKYDTVVAINVIEHTKNDDIVSKNINNLLVKEGLVIVLVPAHMFLFGSYDKLAKHYRRYSKEGLAAKLKKAGFAIEKISYANKMAAIGWFINARIFKKKEFSKSQLYVINLLVPIIDFMDKIIPFDFGLSIICVAKKSVELKVDA